MRETLFIAILLWNCTCFGTLFFSKVFFFTAKQATNKSCWYLNFSAAQLPPACLSKKMGTLPSIPNLSDHFMKDGLSFTRAFFILYSCSEKFSSWQIHKASLQFGWLLCGRRMQQRLPDVSVTTYLECKARGDWWTLSLNIVAAWLHYFLYRLIKHVLSVVLVKAVSFTCAFCKIIQKVHLKKMYGNH